MTLFEIIVFNQTISMIINNALYEWNHFFLLYPKWKKKVNNKHLISFLAIFIQTYLIQYTSTVHVYILLYLLKLWTPPSHFHFVESLLEPEDEEWKVFYYEPQGLPPRNQICPTDFLFTLKVILT